MPQIQRLLLLSLRLSLTLAFLSSCATTPPNSSPPLQGGQRHGLYWEARRGSQTVTLVGTMHVGVQSQHMPAWFWQRFDSADTLVTEVDLAGMNRGLMQRFLILSQPSRLDRLLSTADWGKLQTIVQAAFPQTEEAQLRQMTPLAACSHLMLAEAQLVEQQHPTEAKQDLQTQMSMDQALVEKGRLQGKRLLNFESLLEQFNYLEQVFTLDQLREMLASSEENRAYYQELATAYQTDNADAIDAMVASMPAQLRELLLDKRNQKWGQKLNSLLSAKHTLIAVGAAHLGGPLGLLELLKTKGFQLRALKPKP